MNIHEAHEYALCLSSDIARINSKHPILKRYFGSVWEEINTKEKTYIRLKKETYKMTITELIKGLNDEGEFPLPDTMIDEIIKALDELEILRQEKKKRVEANWNK